MIKLSPFKQSKTQKQDADTSRKRNSMNLRREQVVLLVIGLLLLSFLLDSLVLPLNLNLETPYHYLNLETITQYPFSTISLLTKTIATLLIPVVLFSLFQKSYAVKSVTLFITSLLMQLYGVQDLASGSSLLPLEWSLAVTFSGAGLLILSIYYLLRSVLAESGRLTSSLRFKINTDDNEESK